MNSACSTQELKRKEIQDQCEDYGGGGGGWSVNMYS